MMLFRDVKANRDRPTRPLRAHVFCDVEDVCVWRSQKVMRRKPFATGAFWPDPAYANGSY